MKIKQIKQKITEAAVNFLCDLREAVVNNNSVPCRSKDISAKSWLMLLLAASVYALVSRLLVMYFEPQVSRDAVYYLELVKQWSQSRLVEMTSRDPFFFIPPFMIYCIQLLVKVGCPILPAAIGLNLLMNLSLVPLTCFSALLLFRSRKLSVIAAFLMAVHPGLVEIAPDVMRENFMLAGVLWCIIFALLGFYKSKYFFLLTGFFSAVSAMVRYESMEIIGILGIIWLVMLFNKVPFLKVMVQGLLFIAGFAAGIVILSILMDIPADFYTKMAIYIFWRAL